MTRKGQRRATRRDPTPHQMRCWLAYGANIAQVRGLRVRIVTVPQNPRNGTTGRIVRQTIDHTPTLTPEKGGSTVALHFEDGSRIPLEQVQRIERAGD